MAIRELPSPDLLRKILRYEPDSGKLYWQPRAGGFPSDRERRRWNTRYAGTEAGTLSVKGYSCIGVNGVIYPAHRIIWVMVYGIAPQGEIDHINHDRLDNRIVNLRDVPQAINAKNQKMRKTNTSGVIGVDWDKREGKWRAQFTKDGKRVRLGVFADKQDAIAARKAAEQEAGYHANHGLA